MKDKIVISKSHLGMVMSKTDMSPSAWQKLKDNRPLKTEESFKPKDGGSSYSTFELFENTSICRCYRFLLMFAFSLCFLFAVLVKIFIL